MRNARFSLAQQFINIGLAIGLVPYLLWQLGTQGYGLWLVLQLFNIFGLMALADLGFQGALIRHFVRHHAHGEVAEFQRLLSTALALFAAIGVTCALAVALFAQTAFTALFDIPAPQQSTMRLALTVYSLNLAVSFPLLVIKAVYSGTQDVATLKLWEVIERIIFALLVVGTLFIERSLLALVVCELVALVIAAAALTVAARRRHRPWCSPRLSLVSGRGLDKVASMSGLMFVYNAANQLFVKGPEVLVGMTLGASALAYFTIATRIPRVLKSLQSAINAAVLPHASLLEAQSGTAGAKGRFTLAGLRTSYLVMVPVSVFLIVFAPEILHLWVGEDYVWLRTFMVAALAWQVFGIVGTFGGATLTSNAQLRMPAWASLALNAGLLTVLAFTLERIGLAGLFAALLAAGLIGSGIMLQAVHHANGFGYAAFGRSVVVGPVMLSGAIGLGLFSAARWLALAHGYSALLFATLAAGLVYLATLYALILAPHERLAVTRLFARTQKSR